MHRSSFEYVHVGTKCIFSLAHRRPFLFPVAGRSSVAGHAGGPRIHTRRTFAPPAGLRGARALGGVQKSLDVASDHGIAFRPAEPSKAMETPKISFFFCFSLCCCFCYKCHSSLQKLYTLPQPRYNSSRFSSFSPSRQPWTVFSMCECVRMCHRT